MAGNFLGVIEARDQPVEPDVGGLPGNDIHDQPGAEQAQPGVGADVGGSVAGVPHIPGPEQREGQPQPAGDQPAKLHQANLLIGERPLDK